MNTYMILMNSPHPSKKKNTEKDISATEWDINIPATGLEKIASHWIRKMSYDG